MNPTAGGEAGAPHWFRRKRGRPRKAPEGGYAPGPEGVVAQAYRMANDFARRGGLAEHLDDLVSECLLAAAACQRRYDPTRVNERVGKAASFSTYSGTAMYRRMERYAELVRGRREVADPGEVLAYRADPGAEPALTWCGADWEYVLGLLPCRKQREAVRLRFVEDLTLDEAGRRMGVSKERVRQLLTRSLERLKRKVPAGMWEV